ncbi:unnamed protein product [Anisakis simplex]|uniref:Transposase n=1 Tax=Anisakis simplex TaxID=6269 RepID=A0A0M3JXN9_ANISI|nr:unnamed protein product [Anisakis simplex]
MILDEELLDAAAMPNEAHISTGYAAPASSGAFTVPETKVRRLFPEVWIWHQAEETE